MKINIKEHNRVFIIRLTSAQISKQNGMKIQTQGILKISNQLMMIDEQPSHWLLVKPVRSAHN